MNRKIIVGIAAVIILAVVLAGMWLDFRDKQSLKWELEDEKLYEGFAWLSTNTEEGDMVLAWWDLCRWNREDRAEERGDTRSVEESQRNNRRQTTIPLELD